MNVESVVPDFVRFWDAAAGRPRDVQRRLWHELYERPHGDLFDLYYTNWSSPELLDAALDRRVPDVDVRLLVGLFSSDGWVTTFRGRRTLFLAVEYLPEYDDVFFAHECAHLVHRAAGFDGETVAAAVVAEGFAVRLSAELVPGRDEAAYLWMRGGHEHWLAECVSREAELRERLRDDLDSEDAAIYSRWFLGRANDVGLPPRCGYFVAHRWVRELGVPLGELVTWDYAQARSALLR